MDRYRHFAYHLPRDGEVVEDKKVCALPENEDLWAIGRGFIVRDLPWTEKKLRELPPFFREEHRIIVPLSVQETLDEEIARKLA